MNLENSFFIVGTGTDVGKTYVSALLYKSLRERKASYYKPIQSGGEKEISPDVEIVCSTSGVFYDPEMCTYVLKAPLSPHLSAEMESVALDSILILEKIEEKILNSSFTIIEGAGGICVPLNREGFLYSNLIKNSKLPVVLVAETRVGTINHTLLTLHYLKSMEIPVLGIIFNRFKDQFYERDNIEMVTSLSGVKNFLIIDEGCQEIDAEKIINFLKKENSL